MPGIALLVRHGLSLDPPPFMPVTVTRLNDCGLVLTMTDWIKVLPKM